MNSGKQCGRTYLETYSISRYHFDFSATRVVVFPRLLKASETLNFCVPHAIREKFLLLEQSDFDHYPDVYGKGYVLLRIGSSTAVLRASHSSRSVTSCRNDSCGNNVYGFLLA